MSAVRELSVSGLTCPLCTDIIDVALSPPVSPTKRKWYSPFPGWVKEYLFSKIQEVACNHLFCQKCYKDFLAKSEGTLRCPLCREEVDDTLFEVDEKINEEVIISAFLNDFNKTPTQDSFTAAQDQIKLIKDKVKKNAALTKLVKFCIKLKTFNFIMELEDSVKAQAVQYLYDPSDKKDYNLKSAVEIYESIRSPEISFVSWPKLDAFKSDMRELKSQGVFKRKCFTVAYKSVIILTISAVAFFSLCYVRTIFKNRLSIF